jgi:hypothetical protein
MKRANLIKHLVLRKETILTITRKDLTQVQGAELPSSASCDLNRPYDR